MQYSNADLEQAVSELTAKQKRAFTRSTIYTSIAVLVGALWVAYSLYQVRKFQNESRQLQIDIEQKSEQLKELQEKLDKTQEGIKTGEAVLNGIAPALRLTKNQVKLLTDHAFYALKNSSSDDPGLPFLLEEMEKAEEELAKIKNTTADNKYRSSITVRYYEKPGDKGAGLEAMYLLRDERKFRIAIEEPRDIKTSTNAIWLVSPNLSPEVIKLVAYYLVRVGIQIRHIGTSGAAPDPKYLRGIKGKMIWVGSKPEYLKNDVWTVERIRTTSNFYNETN